MTPRHDIYWIDAEATSEAMLQGIRGSRHEQVVVAKGTLDKVVRVLRKQDLLDLHLDGKLLLDKDGSGSAVLLAALREPLIVHDGATVLQVLEIFRNCPIQMALIVDEYGALRGALPKPTCSKRLRATSRTGVTNLTSHGARMARFWSTRQWLFRTHFSSLA